MNRLLFFSLALLSLSFTGLASDADFSQEETELKKLSICQRASCFMKCCCVFWCCYDRPNRSDRPRSPSSIVWKPKRGKR